MRYITDEVTLIETDPARLLSGVTILDIIARLDSSYELVYLDYSNNFDDNLDPIQDAIRQGSWEPLDMSVESWEGDARWESVKEIKKNLVEELAEDVWDTWCDDYDPNYEQREAHIKSGAELVVFDQYQEWIEEEIYERDSSNPLKTMLGNTQAQAMHYPAGWDDGPNDDIDETVWSIKKHLGIQKRETHWDKEIRTMVEEQIWAGGQLVFYWTGDVEEWVTTCTNLPSKCNAIAFEDPYIAIIDTMNGSGYYCRLEGFKITVPFDQNNITIDACQHYNYTHEVCGMRNNWCDETTTVLTHKRYRRKNATIAKT